MFVLDNMIKIDFDNYILDALPNGWNYKWAKRSYKYIFFVKRNRRDVLAAMRKVVPGNIASQIVGVQPMQGPAPGQVIKLKVRYENDDE